MAQIICCTCLSLVSSDVTFYTLDSAPTSSDDLNLEEKLLYCVPEFEEVLTEDVGTPWICNNCAQALCLGYSFRKTCLAVKDRLKMCMNNASSDASFFVEETKLYIQTEVFIDEDYNPNKTDNPPEESGCFLTQLSVSGSKEEKTTKDSKGRMMGSLKETDEEPQFFGGKSKELEEIDMENRDTKADGLEKENSISVPSENITQERELKSTKENGGTEEETKKELQLKHNGNIEELEEICHTVKDTLKAEDERRPRKRGRPRKRVGFFLNNKRTQSPLSENINPQRETEEPSATDNSLKDNSSFSRQLSACDEKTTTKIVTKEPRKRGRPRKRVGFFLRNHKTQPALNENTNQRRETQEPSETDNPLKDNSCLVRQLSACNEENTTKVVTKESTKRGRPPKKNFGLFRSENKTQAVLRELRKRDRPRKEVGIALGGNKTELGNRSDEEMEREGPNEFDYMVFRYEDDMVIPDVEEDTETII